MKGDSPLWVMRAKSNSSAGGVGTLDLQPPAGCMWKVLYCVGYHDDNVAARACNWMFHDGVNASLVLGSNSAVTTGARVPLYSHGNPGAIPSDYTTVWWPEPIILTVDSYCQFQVAAIGAGKKAYWQAVVMELRGVRTWQQD